MVQGPEAQKRLEQITKFGPPGAGQHKLVLLSIMKAVSIGYNPNADTELRSKSMDVGMMMIFSSYGWEEGSDGQMWEEELRLGEIAADLGFDCLWSA